MYYTYTHIGTRLYSQNKDLKKENKNKTKNKNKTIKIRRKKTNDNNKNHMGQTDIFYYKKKTQEK